VILLKEIIANIISNKPAAPDCFRMVLDAPDASCALPGQFVHVLCGTASAPLLRRPLSISDAESGRINLLYRVSGTGTDLLSQKRQGDTLNIIGPLGRGLPIENISGRLVLVGGGIGVAPMILAARRAVLSELEAIAVIGSASRDLVLTVPELSELCAQVHVTTEDGSMGKQGLVTDALPSLLKGGDSVFACGPVSMLRAVKQICLESEISAYLSLEERMACGIGACLGCAVSVIGADGELVMKRVCADGPVFKAEEVLL
jgi:dihydroorotate dehydrogenase electron transfer subunit